MKHTILLCILFTAIISCKNIGNKSPATNPNGETQSRKAWIADPEDLFTGEEEISLDSLISAYEKETTIEIAVITLDTTLVGPNDNDMYETTFELANTWGVGKKGKDNGVLIAISKARRKMQIQNGKGTAKVMSDLQTKKFVDSVFVPHFKNDEYYMGTREGVKAIMNYLRDKKW